jgi:hypothetical protein
MSERWLEQAENPIGAHSFHVESGEDLGQVGGELLAEPKAVLDTYDQHIDCYSWCFFLEQVTQAPRKLFRALPVQRASVDPGLIDLSNH